MPQSAADDLCGSQVVHLEEGGEGFDFLGFHHRLMRARDRTGARRVLFLAR